MQLANQFERNGFLVVPDFFSSAEILRLVEHVDAIFSRWMTTNREAYVEHKLINMHSLTAQEYFEGDARRRIRFLNCLALPKLVDFLDELIGVPLHFHNTQLFFNPHDRDQLG